MPSLSELQVGEEAKIVGFNNDELGLLLNEMGFLIDDIIAITGQAPLGDPLQLQNKESIISIRKAEAAQIQVEKI